MIAQAKVTFTIASLMMIGVAWFALSWRYGSIIDRRNLEIEAVQREKDALIQRLEAEVSHCGSVAAAGPPARTAPRVLTEAKLSILTSLLTIPENEGCSVTMSFGSAPEAIRLARQLGDAFGRAHWRTKDYPHADWDAAKLPAEPDRSKIYVTKGRSELGLLVSALTEMGIPAELVDNGDHPGCDAWVTVYGRE